MPAPARGFAGAASPGVALAISSISARSLGVKPDNSPSGVRANVATNDVTVDPVSCKETALMASAEDKCDLALWD